MLRSSAVRPGDMRYASRQIRWIPIESIRPNPRQPRKQFDADALGELAASIRQVGLLQPITVRAIGAQGFELIAGERRLRACQQIGMAQIEAMVLPVHDGDSALMALIENLQREDLHYFEEAEGYLAIMRMHGLSQEELALRIGRSQSAVANKLRLLRLEDPVRTILCEGRLAER
ncbi:MAG: ParB/RepB/Spo0J family partition protein, partial [Clostridia bacterium]